jgi:hypothetical protein
MPRPKQDAVTASGLWVAGNRTPQDLTKTGVLEIIWTQITIDPMTSYVVWRISTS